MLQWGFDKMLGHLDAETLHELYEAEVIRMGCANKAHAPFLTLVTASTVPSSAFQECLLPLLVPTCVLARPAHNLFGFLNELHGLVRTINPEIAEAVAFVETPGNLRDDLAELVRCSKILSVAGSRNTIRVYRELAEEFNVNLVEHGHRMSVAWIPADALENPRLDALAWDICAWDNMGCLSPNALFVEDSVDNVVKLAHQLLEEVEKVERILQPMPMDKSERIARNNGFRDAALDVECLLQSRSASADIPGTALLVFPELQSAQDRFAPHYYPKTLNLFPCRPGLLPGFLEKYSPCGQCLACPCGVEENVISLCEHYGFNRFCRFGEMQDPPPTWKHDGIGTLTPLFIE